jgi:hypothetical protein
MGWFYFVVQAATAAILVLAANTAFADFPRLASLLARDRFLPRQLANRGDKLVFSNGVIVLAIFASILVVAFSGDTSRLIPLYAVGVFLSFTLSQAGMVRHWLDVKKKLGDDSSEVAESDKRWRRSLMVNLLGAIATAVVLVVFVVTKFAHGAWLIVVTIPILVLGFQVIHRHYASVARQLSDNLDEPLYPVDTTVIVPVSGVHRGVLKALQYARSISKNVTAVHVDSDDDATANLRERWEGIGLDIKLVILPSPYRELTRPLLRYIDRFKAAGGSMVTVVVPEFVPNRWWQHLLHNQSSLVLKGALLFKKDVIVTNVPYHLE